MGFPIRRSAEAYAHVRDGQIFIGEAEFLDSDDCLAQMILHELCHALVEGERGREAPDWGLDNTSDRDIHRERACLRLQAFVLGLYGLRQVLAPTTEHRAFYDDLDGDPLSARSEDDCVAAILGAHRAERPPFAPHFHAALAATADIVFTAAAYADEGSLFETAKHRPPAHPSGRGFAPPWHASKRCSDCAWAYAGGRGRAVLRCHALGAARIDPKWPACERFESPPACQSCGACCRAGYDSVTVSRRDPVVRTHPELIVKHERYVEIARQGDHCAALTEPRPGAYACTIYNDRPRPCRDLAPGGEHCLTARRRVGLSL